MWPLPVRPAVSLQEADATMQAEDPDGQAVAIKVLSLRSSTGWKQVELFEREAQALKSLSHPCM